MSLLSEVDIHSYNYNSIIVPDLSEVVFEATDCYRIAFNLTTERSDYNLMPCEVLAITLFITFTIDGKSRINILDRMAKTPKKRFCNARSIDYNNIYPIGIICVRHHSGKYTQR